MPASLKAPFPYFGGKSAVADAVWARLGDVESYCEPFAGSLAVLLGRPHAPRTETVNDLDALLANAWRALQADPEATAHHADWPVNETDLLARHLWLVNRKDEIRRRLEADPEWYDTKAAGWWLWGIACWIGSGWCSGTGPWKLIDGEVRRDGNDGRGVNRQLVHLGDDGLGVNRQRVHLSDDGKGVNRTLIHLGNDGRGVNRQLIHLGDDGKGDRDRLTWTDHTDGLLAYFAALAQRLRHVRVCCGDWRRVVTPAALKMRGTSGAVGILLDPPYSTDERADGVYAHDSGTVAADVREWAIAHGDDPRYRIALCGYDSEHAIPASWTAMRWTANGGYSGGGDGSNGNRHRETIWYSPHCLAPHDELPLFAGSQP